MDDLVLVEPALGVRPWISRTAAERAIGKLLGAAAVNQEKKEQEGYFSPVKIVWGLEYRTDSMQVAIPEPRLLKGAYLLNEVCYDSGNRGARLRDMQVLCGTGTSWMAAMPALGGRAEVGGCLPGARSRRAHPTERAGRAGGERLA